MASTTPGVTLQQIKDYIREGPLLEVCKVGFKNEDEQAEQWKELALVIAKDLSLSLESLSDSERMRIFQYYLPVFFWCWGRVKEQKASGNTAPLVIGIQAVQGCGKTTLVDELRSLFAHVGLKAASVSIDDFYLPFQKQQELIKAHPENFLLGVRGNALTHDLDLGRQTLQALKDLNQGGTGTSVRVPKYDKSAYEGRGDRAEEGSWTAVEGPVDVVLFEGWMLGFSPVADDEVKKIDKDLVPINNKLREYEEAWDRFVDAWLVVKVSDPNFVFKWRQQAEQAMKASGKPGMSDDQVKDFVNRYMPAYKAYLPKMYSSGPSTGRGDNVVTFEIDESRGLVRNPDSPLPAKEF